MKSTTYLLVILLIATSCGSGKAKKTESEAFSIKTDSSLVSTENQAAPASKNKPDKRKDLQNFFEEFYCNESFARERSLFPLTINNKQIKSNSDWRFFNDFDDTEFVTFLSSDTIENLPEEHKTAQVFLVNLFKHSAKRFDFSAKSDKWYFSGLLKIPFKQAPDQEFLAFLEKYASDSTFQKQHTVFPFRYFTYNEETYEHLPVELTNESEFSYCEQGQSFDHLIIPPLNAKSAERTIFHQGNGTGVMVIRKFKKIKGQWFCYEMTDYST